MSKNVVATNFVTVSAYHFEAYVWVLIEATPSKCSGASCEALSKCELQCSNEFCAMSKNVVATNFVTVSAYPCEA